MEPALQRRVQRYGWDKASPYYESFWQRQLKPAQDLLLELAKLQPGERVLDVACGTGLVSFRALEAVGAGPVDGTVVGVRDGTVVGTDISDKMIEAATGAAAQKGVTGVRFQQMDAEALALPDASFDVALCALGLMYMPAPLRALAEMFRVLQSGGRIVTAVWGQRPHCGWAEIFEIVDRHVASEVCPMFFNLGNPGALKINLEAAGFSAIHIDCIRTVLHYDNDREALGAAFDGGPVALAYHKFTDAVKEEVHADYLASIAPYKKGDGYDVPGEFVVASAVR
jgi:ubiquinone/menaquinone biosynthesis C-methylase UbiE